MSNCNHKPEKEETKSEKPKSGQSFQIKDGRSSEPENIELYNIHPKLFAVIGMDG
jgi:hypothetical protein